MKCGKNKKTARRVRYGSRVIRMGALRQDGGASLDVEVALSCLRRALARVSGSMRACMRGGMGGGMKSSSMKQQGQQHGGGSSSRGECVAG